MGVCEWDAHAMQSASASAGSAAPPIGKWRPRHRGPPFAEFVRATDFPKWKRGVRDEIPLPAKSRFSTFAPLQFSQVFQRVIYKV